MAKAAQANEPSMEEILASIRKIISDEEATAKPVQAPEPVSTRRNPAEVAFDRRWEVEAAVAGLEEAATPPVSEIDAAAEPADVANDDDEDEDEAEAAIEASQGIPAEIPSFVRSVIPEPAPRQAMTNSPARAAEAPAPDPRLLSPGPDAVVSEAFNRLASTMFANQSRSLEDLVQDMLRPMLRGWLDDNLPTMVERLVREEIERVSRGPRR